MSSWAHLACYLPRHRLLSLLWVYFRRAFQSFPVSLLFPPFLCPVAFCQEDFWFGGGFLDCQKSTLPQALQSQAEPEL